MVLNITNGRETRSSSTSKVEVPEKEQEKNKSKKSIPTGKKPATATTLCGVCKEDVLDEPQTYEEKSIECECCLKWFHSNCGQLEENKFNAITTLDLHWYCPACENGSKRLKQHIVKIESEQGTMKKELEELKTKVEESEKNILENINTNLNQMIDERIELKLQQLQQLQPQQPQPAETSPTTSRVKIASVVNATLTEREEIQKRKLNLVIHNLPEPTGEEETETSLLKTLIEEKLQIDDEITIKDITRLGNPRDDDSPRLLKIELETLSMKRKILSCAIKLRNIPENDTFAKVYVKPDLTKKQQTESKNLKEKLDQWRIDHPEHRWQIYRGKITRCDSIRR